MKKHRETETQRGRSRSCSPVKEASPGPGSPVPGKLDGHMVSQLGTDLGLIVFNIPPDTLSLPMDTATSPTPLSPAQIRERKKGSVVPSAPSL